MTIRRHVICDNALGRPRTIGEIRIDESSATAGAWTSRDHDQNPPVDDPSRADTGNRPDSFTDLGAFEHGGPMVLGTVSPAGGLAPLSTRVDDTASVGLTAPTASYRVDCPRPGRRRGAPERVRRHDSAREMTPLSLRDQRRPT
jgi:hypothetical protein